ncbi:ankyrin repeat domain-containing protein 49-like [Anneissia japonica]|uniref:ankyrin repeat domain-containing protein 49-like n=1 Tax=Anneissia japonica TaxID=1529436 RepID=UPI001425A81A|nr:ankyrin repeat domain-containing protein 49-like [Anneissia japonica]
MASCLDADRISQISVSIESINQLEMQEKLLSHDQDNVQRQIKPITASTLTLDNNDSEEATNQSRSGIYAEAVEHYIADQYEYNGVHDPEDQEKVRMRTELLLKVMEEQTKRKTIRQSYGGSDDDLQSDIREDVETDPSKRCLWAAENNELDIIKEIINNDASCVGCCDEDGYTPLHRASYNGHVAMVTYLLGHNASVRARTLDGWEPLHCACRWGQASVAAILLENGADINSQTNGGQTALHLASSNREAKDVLELLLMNRYIDPSIHNGANETAYNIARRVGPLAYLFKITDKSLNQVQ